MNRCSPTHERQHSQKETFTFTLPLTHQVLGQGETDRQLSNSITISSLTRDVSSDQSSAVKTAQV